MGVCVGNSNNSSVNGFSTAVLTEDTEPEETNIVNQTETPNWQEADQFAIYKAWRS